MQSAYNAKPRSINVYCVRVQRFPRYFSLEDQFGWDYAPIEGRPAVKGKLAK